MGSLQFKLPEKSTAELKSLAASGRGFIARAAAAELQRRLHAALRSV